VNHVIRIFAIQLTGYTNPPQLEGQNPRKTQEPSGIQRSRDLAASKYRSRRQPRSGLYRARNRVKSMPVTASSIERTHTRNDQNHTKRQHARLAPISRVWGRGRNQKRTKQSQSASDRGAPGGNEGQTEQIGQQTRKTRARPTSARNERRTIGKSVKMRSRKCAPSWNARGGDRATSDAPDLIGDAEIGMKFVEKSKAHMSFAQKAARP
jgi:hypothetical protein